MNKFSYQSIEEVDPVDLATLLGSAGGMWGERQDVIPVSELYCTVEYFTTFSVNVPCPVSQRVAHVLGGDASSNTSYIIRA